MYKLGGKCLWTAKCPAKLLMAKDLEIEGWKLALSYFIFELGTGCYSLNELAQHHLNGMDQVFWAAREATGSLRNA